MDLQWSATFLSSLEFSSSSLAKQLPKDKKGRVKVNGGKDKNNFINVSTEEKIKPIQRLLQSESFYHNKKNWEYVKLRRWRFLFDKFGAKETVINEINQSQTNFSQMIFILCLNFWKLRFKIFSKERIHRKSNPLILKLFFFHQVIFLNSFVKYWENQNVFHHKSNKQHVHCASEHSLEKVFGVEFKFFW